MFSSVPADAAAAGSSPLRAQLEARLVELQQELEVGQRRMRQIELEQAQLRETMLRISGAIQVLEEVLGSHDQSQGGDA